MLGRFNPAVLVNFFLMSVMVSTFSSCSEDDPITGEEVIPVACYESVTTASASTLINFNSSCSENASLYNWDFGGIATSEDESPTYTFTNPGEYEVSLTVTSTSGHQDVVTKTISVTAQKTCVSHYGTITEDEVWTADNMHCISGSLSIQGATVTIEPGAIIRFTNGGAIDIGYNAPNTAFIAEGTAENPITFTSGEDNPQPGDWSSLTFSNGSTENSILKHCIIEYGGENFSSEKLGAVRILDGGKVVIENTTFRNSFTYDVELDYNTDLFQFNNNTLENDDHYSLKMSTFNLHSIGVNNVINSPGIYVESIVMHDSYTWKKQTSPYVMDGGIAFGSTEGTTLAVEPGVRFEFMDNYFDVEVGYEGTKGALIAVGTEEDPIVFTSHNRTPAPGDWGGLTFTSGTMTGTILDHVIIEYASGDMENYGAINLKSSAVSIKNTILRHTRGIGINASFGFQQFENNHLSEIGGYPIKIYGNQIKTFGPSNVIEADEKPIYVIGNPVTGIFRWRDLGVPYLVDGQLFVEDDGTELTIDPGVEMRFTENSGMTIGNGTNTLFIAQGTAEKPIIFTSSAIDGSPAPGDWEGLNFSWGLVEGSIMEHCQVSYGGGYFANLYFYSVGPEQITVRNCHVTHSESYGIYRSNGADPVLENITYENNTSGDLY